MQGVEAVEKPYISPENRQQDLDLLDRDFFIFGKPVRLIYCNLILTAPLLEQKIGPFALL